MQNPRRILRIRRVCLRKRADQRSASIWRHYSARAQTSRGLAPNPSELQFIDLARIKAAQQRVAQSLPDDRLIVGVDAAADSLAGKAQTSERSRRATEKGGHGVKKE
jgi:hypothetical protein